MADKISLFRVVESMCSTTQSADFLAFLKFCISEGDKTILSMLQILPCIISSGIQIQVIELLGYHIRGKIIRRVQTAHCSTIIADEVTDCSNKEQLCLALRYVNPDNYTIHVTFIECGYGITRYVLV